MTGILLTSLWIILILNLLVATALVFQFIKDNIKFGQDLNSKDKAKLDFYIHWRDL